VKGLLSPNAHIDLTGSLPNSLVILPHHSPPISFFFAHEFAHALKCLTDKGSGFTAKESVVFALWM